MVLNHKDLENFLPAKRACGILFDDSDQNYSFIKLFFIFDEGEFFAVTLIWHAQKSTTFYCTNLKLAKYDDKIINFSLSFLINW